MATARKRITRKDLRQPDWFQVGVEKVLDYYEANRGKVILGLASLIVLLLLLGGWQLFKQRQNSLAAHEFGKALALYHGAKYREAVAALENVKGYRWSEYAPLADLYQANSYLLTNDLERALPSAQRFVSATRPNTLYRQIGLVAVAVTQERMKQCKAAIENYREAEKISAPFRDKAISGRARCHEQTGEFKAAIAAYREHLREQPSGIVPLKIAELEAKVVEGGKK
jgi:predicted negative regulator of RcsB-dependent stress response